MSELLTARIMPLERLFQLGSFRPAAVQRDYQWDEFRAERLLREITEAMSASGVRRFQAVDVDEGSAPGTEHGAADSPSDESVGTEPSGLAQHMSEVGAPPPKPISAFYIGAMVLSPSGPSTYEIFDGLQRLTTLTILLSVLRDLMDDVSLKNRLHASIVAAQGDFRLRHAGADTTLANTVQTLGQAGVRRQNRSRPIPESARRVFDVARRFVVLLQRRVQGERSALATFLLEHVLTGIVETNDPRLARHIFVATNLYGLPLRRDEVFKGQVLALAPNAETLTQLEKIWDSVRETVGQATLEEFLIAFDLIWRRQAQGADCLGDLIDHLAKPESAGEVVTFMNSLQGHAAAWKELESYLRNPSGGALGNHIWRLSFFKWKEWKPLALHWMERHLANAGDERQYARSLKRFAELNRRCVAITLYDFGEERCAEMFLKALQHALRSKSVEPFSRKPGSRLPLDFSVKVRETVKAALMLPIEDYGVRRTLILWYEALLWPRDLAPGLIAGGSVEHILPEKPDLRSRWLGDFPQVEERYFMHSSIGNLALVDPAVNFDLGNKDFVHKLSILKARNQFGKYKSLADVESENAWTPTVIQQRARAMASRIWDELSLPEPGVR